MQHLNTKRPVRGGTAAQPITEPDPATFSPPPLSRVAVPLPQYLLKRKNRDVDVIRSSCHVL